MTRCPECSTQVSIADVNCPSCNFPVSKLRGLSAATLTQNSELVAALIQMGADVNSVDQNGRTPLMIASFIGDIEIVEMLLAAGADPEFTNNAGENALSIAQSKEVERLLRRAIVVIKFSAARKKQTDDEIVNPKMKMEEPPRSDEVPPDIEDALKHLEPVYEPPPLSLDVTQPMEILFQEISSDEFVPAIKTLDTTQPIPVVFQELEESTEEDETFIELQPDLEESPRATEIDQFIQIELQANDVKPAILFESNNEYSSLTLDPLEELLTELPEVRNSKADEIDEIMQTELHASENVFQVPSADLFVESVDPTEQVLEESEKVEIEITVPEVEPIIEEPVPVISQAPPVHRELQRWDEWKQIEQAVAFAPWKIEDQSLKFDPEDKIELAQPIDEVIAPKPPEVPPQIFLNSTRTRNIVIGLGVAIFLIQFLLFLNWQLNSRKPATIQTKVTTPVKKAKPIISTTKPSTVKIEPALKVENVKKSEPKTVAAINPLPPQPSKKPAKQIKSESKKSRTAPAALNASVKSPVNEERITKARELNNQGSSLLREGRVSEGISLLEQAVHTFPKGTKDENYASALLNLGRAWRMAGRPDITIRILEKRMKINIERDAVARELLAAKRQAVESGMGIRND